jgi:16S rRNA processing protein RimM
MRPDRPILVGVFGAPQGVSGEIRVKSFTGDPKAIGAYGPLADAKAGRVFAFERLRALKGDMLVVKVKGLETREAAAALAGVELFARRDRLPPPSQDEFYYADLVGLEAVTATGEKLGRVVTVNNYGAGDILEIAPEDGGETLLAPFTKAVAPVIDFEAGRIVIEPPEEIAGGPDAP